MKIIKNKWFPFGGYKAINLFGIVFTKSDLSDVDKNHEAIHSRLMVECFVIGLIVMLILIFIAHINWLWIFLSIPTFYIWYGIEYIIKFFSNLDKSLNEVYHMIGFEKEAYYGEGNLAYLRLRKAYAWLKYE